MPFAYVYMGRATQGSSSSPASDGTWGPHTNRALPGENQLEAVGSLHSFAITALALGPPGTVVSFISAFPAWLGELIRQRNHYGFKSHTPHRK